MSASKILVPIGFSEQSIVALGQAFNLAKIKDSEIVLLSVIEEPSMMESLFMDDKTHELQHKVNERLQEIGDEYGKKYGVHVETMVAKGKVYEQINEVAEMVSANLIVMGTNGTPAGKIKKYMGSNAERVVGLAHCPVITIKGKQHRVGCKNIILPLDLEKQTREKVTYALEYARYCEATIRVVSVVFRDNHAVRDKLKKNIKQVEKSITDASGECSAELVEGEKKRTLGDFIFEYEKQVDADLIMIMTKKEELILSNNISVTARYIINNSAVPVMSIRPKERIFATGSTTAF